MGFFHKLMTKLDRYRLIPDRRTGEDYMHRYYLFLKDRKNFPFNVTLHKIVKSDDPIFHDHPWPYLTIILKGGYYEHTPVFDSDGKKFAEFSRWRGPGSIIWRKAKDYHWLELEGDQPAVTLFFMGKQQRDWGFMTNTKTGSTRWIQWQNYLTNFKQYHKLYVEPRIKSASRKKQ